MKKGFTIVELAIVLVVIGIILGMAVKGKALVDAARMRAEVAKMNKFEAAAYTYYAQTNYLPAGAGTATNIANADFISRELLTNGDFQVKVGTGMWGFYRCNVATANTSYTDNATGSSVCVTTVSNSTAASWTAQDMASRLACNIEVMKDDENSTAGEGRGWKAVVSLTNFRNCDNYSMGQLSAYAYRVF